MIVTPYPVDKVSSCIDPLDPSPSASTVSPDLIWPMGREKCLVRVIFVMVQWILEKEGSARLEAGRTYLGWMGHLSVQTSYVSLLSNSILLGWDYSQTLSCVFVQNVCRPLLSPLFCLQGGNVFNKREYYHFDTVEFWGVVGLSLHPVFVCYLGVWRYEGF